MLFQIGLFLYVFGIAYAGYYVDKNWDKDQLCILIFFRRISSNNFII